LNEAATACEKLKSPSPTTSILSSESYGTARGAAASRSASSHLTAFTSSFGPDPLPSFSRFSWRLANYGRDRKGPASSLGDVKVANRSN
jgi:hypothetical protein